LKNDDANDVINLQWALDALEVCRSFLKDALPSSQATKYLRRIRSLQRDLKPVLKELEKNANSTKAKDR